MNKTILLLFGTLLLASCGGKTTSPTPSPAKEIPQPETGFSWVTEPLQLWQQQSLYNMNYWAKENPLQIAGYYQQSYLGNSQFTINNYSLTGVGSNTWEEDAPKALIFSISENNWSESDGNFTASEGAVGTAGVKTVYVTDQSGARYYSLERRDLSNKPIVDGLTTGFGDGRLLPDSIKNGTAKFSSGAEAYTWIVDLKNPIYTIDRIHYIFSTNYEVLPVHTCDTIYSYCSSQATSLREAISENGWILNGGGNVSIQLKANNKAEVTYKGEDGTATPQVFQVNYTYTPASTGAPERIVFDKLTSSDSNLTANVAKAMALADTQLAFYTYNGEVVRGTYTPVQTGVKSQSYQYNKQAINDILTQWSPKAPPVVK